MGAQTFLDTQPAPAQAAGQNARWSGFQVTEPAQVLTLLRQLRDGGVPVNLSVPEGGAPYGTTLWALDSASGRLSFSASDGGASLRELLVAGHGVAVAYTGSTKLQFAAEGLELVKGARASALMSRVPVGIYRFQRREYLRVRTDPRQSPRGLVRHPLRPELSVALRVLDVSTGGCGLLVPPETPEIPNGSVLECMRFELDSEARFLAGVTVRHTSPIRGGGGVRLGCEWELIDPPGARALGRYIEMMQRRKRLLALT